MHLASDMAATERGEPESASRERRWTDTSAFVAGNARLGATERSPRAVNEQGRVFWTRPLKLRIHNPLEPILAGESGILRHKSRLTGDDPAVWAIRDGKSQPGMAPQCTASPGLFSGCEGNSP